MPNAAAIATGHYPGDTGQFANQIYIGYPLFATGSLGQRPGTMVPDVEDPFVLADMNHQFGGNYMREASIIAFARSYGYNTATIGKTGPAAAQDLSEAAAMRGTMRNPVTIVLDAATGTSRAIPLTAETVALLKAAGLSPAPPPRNQPTGTNTTPGTRAANVEQQQWFADAATKAILPAFAKSPEPFVVAYWSGDPDLTQHAQGDSLNQLSPGINGATSKAAVQNADRNLKQILDYLDANPDVRDNTNLFVTSDHGFSTVSRRDVDATGRATRSYSATLRYTDAEGRQEVNDGFLPPGFLAIDLARELDLPLFDPEQQADGRYARVEPSMAQPASAQSATVGKPMAGVRRRPTGEAALLGGTGRIGLPIDATVIIAQTSIYVPSNDRGLVRRIVRFLADAGLRGRVVRQRSAGTGGRRAAHERRRPDRRRHDAEAGHRGQLQELLARSEKPAHERRHRRRRAPARAGRSRIAGTRQHVQQHGRHGPRLQEAVRRPVAGKQCRRASDTGARHEDEDSPTRRSSRPRPHRSARGRTRDNEICARSCALARRHRRGTRRS